MKIAIFDHVKKFTPELVEHWQKMGHEVKVDRYFDPGLVHWADTTFFEFCDISIQRASHKEDSMWGPNPQPLNKNIIVRLHDIDAWVGNHNGVVWDWVNHLVFVADHIKDKVTREVKIPETTKIHKIRHGINPDKFIFRNKPRGNKIAWVGNISHHKCIELALQVLAENPEYELHAAGSTLGSWELAYVNSFVERNNLKFFHYPSIDNVNSFLEDKDFILLTSFKEAFNYATGEGMTKGLKPIIHHFFGAETIWDKKYIWDKISEVRPMLEGDFNPQEYHDYMDKNYNFQEYLSNYDKII